MNNDLVKRLRREAGTLATMYEAATEIERLRAEIECRDETIRLQDEHIAKLANSTVQADEIERLQADNKRLTDKLMKIAEKEIHTPADPSIVDDCFTVARAYREAVAERELQLRAERNAAVEDT